MPFEKLYGKKRECLALLVAWEKEGLSPQQIADKYMEYDTPQDMDHSLALGALEHEGFIWTEWDEGGLFSGGRSRYSLIRVNEEARCYFEWEADQTKSTGGTTYNISATGSNVVFGDVTGSTLTARYESIERAIEEKGGEDKEVLLALLEEVKLLVDEMQRTGEVPKKPKLAQRLADHLSKHGWLYGEIIGILGATTIALLS